MYKINKKKCVGCQACLAVCPDGVKIGKDGKAEIVNQKKLEDYGGKDICPLGAIEKTKE